MTNEMSLEGLYMSGLGMSNQKNESYRVGSIEAYDGSSDTVAMEFARSEEALNFLDTFSMIEQKNARDKINMLRRIASCYGNPNNIDAIAANSIESYCVSQSMEAGEAAAATATDGAPETAPETAPKPETTKKKLGFWKTILTAIKNFFEAIWRGITTAIEKIGKFFASFKKKQDQSGAAETTTPSDPEVSLDGKSSSSKSAVGEVKLDVNQEDFLFDWEAFVRGGSGANANRFTTAYKRIVKQAENLDNAFQNEITATTSTRVANSARNSNNQNQKINKETTDKDRMNALGWNPNSRFAQELSAFQNDAQEFARTALGVNDSSLSRGVNIDHVKLRDPKAVKSALNKIIDKMILDKKDKGKIEFIANHLFNLRLMQTNQFSKKNYKFMQTAASSALENLNKLENEITKQIKPSHDSLVKLISKYENMLLAKSGTEAEDFNIGISNFIVVFKYCSKVEAIVMKMFNFVNQSCIYSMNRAFKDTELHDRIVKDNKEKNS